MRAALLFASLVSAGCVLDFEQFHTKPPTRDAPAVVDAVADVTQRKDAVEDIVDASVDVPQEPADVPAACTPGRAAEARFRFANMATGMGAVDLCMRHRTTSGEAFASVAAARWPTAGVSYAQVTTSVRFNASITRTNDAWDFAIVPSGTPCAMAATSAVTLRTVQLDPGVLKLFVLTSERSEDGSSVGVLNVLPDEECTDCSALQVDVRAVHAALGAAPQRMNFSLDPLVAPGLVPQDISTMRTFSSSVSYGGDVGYACNGMWGAIAASRLIGGLVYVQLTASTAATGVALARSEATRLKVTLLQRTRTVTVFFEGDFDTLTGTGSGPGFVVCYDGVAEGSFTNCDRVGASLLPPGDAGADGGAPTDSATGDASVESDADDVIDPAADDDAATESDASVPDDLAPDRG